MLERLRALDILAWAPSLAAARSRKDSTAASLLLLIPGPVLILIVAPGAGAEGVVLRGTMALVSSVKSESSLSVGCRDETQEQHH